MRERALPLPVPCVQGLGVAQRPLGMSLTYLCPGVYGHRCKGEADDVEAESPGSHPVPPKLRGGQLQMDR